MNRYIGVILCAAALLSATPAVAAIELPVKEINGREYYCYTVKRGDTLFSVATSLGVSPDDIKRYNHTAADGLRRGMVIYLPVNSYSDTITAASEENSSDIRQDAPSAGTTPAPVKETVRPVNPVQPASAPVETPVCPENTEAPGSEVAVQQVSPGIVEVSVEVEEESQDTTSIALFAPLMLGDDSNSKAARSATDFVRGFMLGVKPFATASLPVSISVYDTKGSADVAARIMSDKAIDDVDFIVSADDMATFAGIRNNIGDRDIDILNLLAVQDSSYTHIPGMYQANVPHALMYEKAALAMMDIYDGYTPVFLISKGGRSEKIEFTEYLREQLIQRGVTPMNIEFSSILSSNDLVDLDPAGKYVFIPASGTLGEFNKFARALITKREEMILPDNIALFGYPDWIVFRNDALEHLHRLGAVIYSRFYADTDARDAKVFMSEFQDTYGVAAIEQVPSQAMLGYDTARYLMTVLNNTEALDLVASGVYTGLQSSFSFSDNGPEDSESINTGVANQALYIVTFLPGDDVKIQIY